MDVPSEVTSLAAFGVPLLLLVFWLTQVVREAARLTGRWVPPVSIVIGVALLYATRLPEPWVQPLFVGLALAAAANLTVKFTRPARGQE
ncbi:MAG: hypothetical protein IT340_19950 [Chloroflexi bacterium]|nr:hypothetical protein [Chloroflexota bacterium]